MDPAERPALGVGDVARTRTWSLVDGFGPRIASVIAHGSWVHGDFCPGRSDLDLVVVLGYEPERQSSRALPSRRSSTATSSVAGPFG